MSVAGLNRLTTASLRALAAELRRSETPRITGRALEQTAGPHVEAVGAALASLAAVMSGPQAAVVVDAVADTRMEGHLPSDALDLVLSGPDVPGVPMRDTSAVICELIEIAQSEVRLAGYAIHHFRRVFERLAYRMHDVPELKATLVVDIGRPWNDTSLASEIVARFARQFRAEHWLWDPTPDVYYDPRSLSMSRDKRSAMHAKCVVVDRQVAFVTSANFTEAAQERNIEVGVVVRHAPLAARLAEWLEGLVGCGALVRMP